MTINIIILKVRKIIKTIITSSSKVKEVLRLGTDVKLILLSRTKLYDSRKDEKKLDISVRLAGNYFFHDLNQLETNF